MAGNKRLNIPPEEEARIKALPARTFKIGETERNGLYDEENGCFYETDENGELTGKRVRVGAKPTPPKKPAQTPSPAPAEGGEEKSANEKKAKAFGKKKEKAEKKSSFHIEGSDDSDDASADKMKKMKPIFIGACAVIVAASLAFTFLNKPGKSNPSQNPSSSQPPQTQVGETLQPDDLSEIQVVQVIRDLIPGDEITPEDIQSSTISADVFSQITLGGTNLYKWDRNSQLIGKYITTYVPSGQYLSYDAVSSALTFANNPWMSASDGTTFIKVPIDTDNLSNDLTNYGAILNMEIRKQKVNQVATGGQAPADGEAPADVEGINHSTSVEQSLTIDTYTMSDLTICDVLNKDGDSLYNSICSYSGIPAGEQLNYIKDAMKKDDTLQDKLTPAYIMIRVTADQAKALGDLDDKDTAVKLSISEAVDNGNDSKATFAANARSVMATIEEAVAENQEEAENEAAQKEQLAEEALKQQQEEEAKKNG